jgi:hypothetical protein
MSSLLYLDDASDLRPPVLDRAGHDPQVLRHLDLAAAVGVAGEDEDLAFRVRPSRLQQQVAIAAPRCFRWLSPKASPVSLAPWP